jgi:tetratricopeptide (TPR) repeat protein
MFWFLISTPFNREIDSLIKVLLDFTYRENYGAALAIADEIIQKYPQEPDGYFFKAAIYDYYMEDYHTDKYSDKFFSNMEIAEKKAKAKLNSLTDPKERAWMNFYIASAAGYRAMRAGREGNYIVALKYALEGLKPLKSALEEDSTLYDAYFPLGIYHYAISKAPNRIGFIPSFVLSRNREEDKERGINYLTLAWQRGRYTSVISALTLAWVLSQEGRSKEAIPILKGYVEKYPESRYFKWVYGYLLIKEGRFQEAEDIYEKLLYLVLRDQPDSPYNAVYVSYSLGYVKYFLGKFEEALRLFILAEEYYEKAPKKVKGELKEVISQVQKMKNRTLDRLGR